MDKQRGGSFVVSGWIALALLAALVVVGAHSIHLLHRQSFQEMFRQRVQLGPTVIRPKDDYGAVHAFPSYRDVCTSFDTICYTRI